MWLYCCQFWNFPSHSLPKRSYAPFTNFSARIARSSSQESCPSSTRGEVLCSHCSSKEVEQCWSPSTRSRRRKAPEAWRASSPRMPFDEFSFGSIQVDGSTYQHDVIIDRGEIRRRKKKPSKKFRDQFGHTPLFQEWCGCGAVPWTEVEISIALPECDPPAPSVSSS